jgi:2-dehydropantoate 2-reductase
MNVLIVEASGVGCACAARLLHADHSVTLVARGARSAALQSCGLRAAGPHVRFSGPVVALDEAERFATTRAAAADLIILAFEARETGPWL